METRYAIHPEHAKNFDTQKLRKEFLVRKLFDPGKCNLVYSHIDRIIIGGITPAKQPISLEGGKTLACDSFFERREGGIINIGNTGLVKVDGREYKLENRDALYIGKGVKEVTFTSVNPDKPAKMYMLSGPAHKDFPVKQISIDQAKQVKLGSLEESNKRTIYQFIHPAILESCQLCMGMTLLEPQNMWNTMPTHTHDRRMEVYFYFDMDPESVVFHFMGPPSETRHLVVRNEEAVILPSWSIHAGVGTKNYTFIWGMVGENQTFTDMDHVPMEQLA